MKRKERPSAPRVATVRDGTPPGFLEALALQKAGRLAEAEAGFLTLLAGHPTHGGIAYQLGVIALARRDPSTAETRLRQAARLSNRVEPLVALSVALCQCERSGEALGTAAAALAMAPARADVHNDVSVVLRRCGYLDQAVRACRSAITLAPDLGGPYGNLGSLLADLGRHGEALAVFRAGLRLSPDQADLHNSLGGCLNALGRYDEAVAACRRAAEIRWDFPEAFFNLGNALVGTGRRDLAVDAYRLALQLRPGLSEAANNLGLALRDLGRLEEAEAAFRAALASRPDYPQAFNNLTIVLTDLARLGEAEATARSALALMPDYPEAWNNLGNVLLDDGRIEEALSCYRTALAARPVYPEAYANLGNALRVVGRMDEAIAAHREALKLRPDYVTAHRNLAFALLMNGDLAEGWREYEWRKDFLGPHGRSLAKPRWSGDPLAGRTLLLWPQEGLGDQLQFCRYAALAARMGGQVVVETYRPLVRLLKTLPGIDRVIAAGDPLPDFDCHLPVLSLPGVMQTTLANIPAAVPYLRADPLASARWKDRLEDLPGLKVGLVWAGDPYLHDPKANAVDRRRSIEPPHFRPLLALPGVSMVSLQMGAGAARIWQLPPAIRPFDVMAEVEDFADTAAIVDALDLVITVDTSMVHLAGALGKPVWLLSRYDGCWRWFLDRDDSPWYPTLRLFRQSGHGMWDEVIARVVTALEERVGEMGR